jgi:hypothetical protein
MLNTTQECREFPAVPVLRYMNCGIGAADPHLISPGQKRESAKLISMSQAARSLVTLDRHPAGRSK